ncbi:MAG TPA: hypothetical protein PK079_14170 [Leptospiraceae bacterium]|nr:hypothetical protein [Leptospiraceae bacterium]HMW04163.1 hypothetical protein [Leptospiraceae bacterium]HMX34666.1 hypothetical protein [Leptospiraceae bacterium]HMY30156.1 hypothetical protein [Leptospiraceae bacterium]HMZ67219.1 hypothetical protein [Leptospiraceae bacterium]
MNLDSINKNIYYLNLKELKLLCDIHKIPYKILYKSRDGKIKNTGILDRKEKIIQRILLFLKERKIGKPTLFPQNVILQTEITNLTPKEKIYFGLYKNGNKEILELLKSLTESKFKFGATAQLILLDSWAKGKLLTFQEFSQIWLKESQKKISHPEWAYLSDLANGNVKDWKNKRSEIAKEVIESIKKQSF